MRGRSDNFREITGKVKALFPLLKMRRAIGAFCFAIVVSLLLFESTGAKKVVGRRETPPKPSTQPSPAADDVAKPQPPRKPTEIDATSDSVTYSADEVDYDVENDIIVLLGNARVTYGAMDLRAAKITFYAEKDLAIAEGVPDSSSESGFTGTPVFRDAEEELRGTRMSYNIRTGNGIVEHGTTEFEKGFYTGKDIGKVSENTIKVLSGTFTTCDVNSPHYHFSSRQMKIIRNDKVVAKPVIFYVSDIPTLWFPFYVFPIKKGRHSGFLVPKYGSSSYDGRYIRNVGYYWSSSDYWDTSLRGSLFEKTGWLVESSFRYALRYRFKGTLSGSFKQETREGTKQGNRWDLNLNHSHTTGPNSSLRADATFVSDKDYFRDTSFDPTERMNRTVRSNLVFNKRWPKSGANLYSSISHSKFLETSQSTLFLPRLILSLSRKQLFPPKNEKSPRTPATDEWYRSIYYSLKSTLVNYRRATKGEVEKHLGVDNSLSVSGSGDLGWLKLLPSIDFSETWFSNYRREVESDGSSVWENVNSPARRGDFRASISANTTFYGIFNTKVWKLVAMRHVLKPRAAFRYHPKFKGLDKYYSFSGISGVGGPERSLSISLDNIFQAKIKEGETEKKFDLATVNLSTNYNFEAEKRKLSPLLSSIAIKPSRIFDVRMNMRHNFYTSDDRIDFRSMRAESLDLTTALRLSGGRSTGSQRERPASSEYQSSMETDEPEDLVPGLDRTSDFDEVTGYGDEGPWRFNLSYRYSVFRSLSYVRRTSWVRGELSFKPTKRWRILYSFNYDLRKKEATSQSFSIYRDLHCWEAKLIWTPSGLRKGYYLLLNIKEIPEIKIERRRGSGSFVYP